MAWWLNRTGQPEGPYEDQQLLYMIQSGQVRGGYIGQHGGNSWMPIEQHPTFGAALRGGVPVHGYGAPATQAPVAAPVPKKSSAAPFLVAGLVALIGLVGLGRMLFDRPKVAPPGPTITAAEAEARAAAFQRTYEALKKIDPASVPKVFTDGYAGLPQMASRQYLFLFAEDLKAPALHAEAEYRPSSTLTGHSCAYGQGQLQQLKQKGEPIPAELLLGCSKLEYVLVIRVGNLFEPKVNSVTKNSKGGKFEFSSGSISGDVVAFALEDGKPLGGFSFRAESSEEPPKGSSPHQILKDDLRKHFEKALEEGHNRALGPAPK